MIILHNVTKKYSEIYDINGDKLNKAVTAKGKIIAEDPALGFHPCEWLLITRHA